MTELTVSDAGVHVGARLIAHTTTPWHVKTNRHTTTSGRSWGWIEGASRDATWSDDHESRFTGKQASEAAAMHNQWLEAQRPVALRLIDANDRLSRAARNLAEANQRLEAAEREHSAAVSAVEALESERSAATKRSESHSTKETT